MDCECEESSCFCEKSRGTLRRVPAACCSERTGSRGKGWVAPWPVRGPATCHGLQTASCQQGIRWDHAQGQSGLWLEWGAGWRAGVDSQLSVCLLRVSTALSCEGLGFASDPWTCWLWPCLIPVGLMKAALAWGRGGQEGSFSWSMSLPGLLGVGLRSLGGSAAHDWLLH